MEDPQLLSGSDSNLSDSWTLLNGESAEQVNGNEEIEEPSDAESLEVLEVEQADSNETVVDDEITESEHRFDGNVTECDGSQDEDIPVFQIIATQKTKKYVHHPNPYVNMWLSIMMVIAIAITLGLGMGHYLGTKRFSKAADIIQHLQCKNHMLEMDLAKFAAKHKACERNLHETENIFNILMNGSHEEFLKEDQARQDIPLKASNTSTLSPPNHNPCERRSKSSSCQLSFFNHNFSDNTRIKGDESIKNSNFSISKLEGISKNIISPTVHMSFVVLNNKLSSLRFLLKKWSQHVNDSNLKHSAKCRNKSYCEDHYHTAELPRNISRKICSQTNEESSLNQAPNNLVSKFTFTSLHNHCCRSPTNINKRHEDKLQSRTGREILPGSVFYIPFKEIQPYHLPNFLEVGNESVKFHFQNRGKWGPRIINMQDTLKSKDFNRGDYKKCSKSLKGNKFCERKYLHSNFERSVLHRNKKRFIDVFNTQFLFQKPESSRNNKNIKKTYSGRSNFKHSHFGYENVLNKIKSRNEKNKLRENHYNEKHRHRGKQNFDNQKLKNNYKSHSFIKNEYCWDKNVKSKFKHLKVKDNHQYHQTNSISIKKYFQKENKKDKYFYKIDHELYSKKKTKNIKLNNYSVKENSKFHDSASSFKYNKYKDEKNYGKKFEVSKSLLKKRKLNQLEFKPFKVSKY